jgi:hypothetical protein
MDNTLTDTRPTFARLTEKRTSVAWRAALPAVIVGVGFAALVAYLASSVSTSEQKAIAARKEADQAREQTASLLKQQSHMQADLALARDPGRVAVILRAQQPEKAAKGKKVQAASPSSTWAAATWGESGDGRTWMRVDAYGLSEHPEDGGNYHAWMMPASGDPIDLGAFDTNPNGSGFLMTTNLPPIDQGKSIALSIDTGAKQMGKVVAQADLPKLQPMHNAAPQATPSTLDQPPQAKAGETPQQMHQQAR